jgi:hypothetical protein
MRSLSGIKISLLAILFALLLFFVSYPVFADNTHPQPENRVGMMSQDVVRARLQQLGYTQPLEIRPQANSPQIIQSPQILQRNAQPLEQIELNNRLVPAPQYDVTTVKDGTDVLLKVDPLSGRIEEIQLGN